MVNKHNNTDAYRYASVRFRLGKTAAATFRDLQSIEEFQIIDRATVFRWFHEFSQNSDCVDEVFVSVHHQ
jgi:hypothetical protein